MLIYYEIKGCCSNMQFCQKRRSGMKKKLQTAFTTRQYMLSKDFEIYYYNEKYTSKIEMHTAIISMNFICS